MQFAQGDPQDKYRAEDGFLHVSHNPGCGWTGNNGNDTFFTPQLHLPFWATIQAVEFEQFWPKERKPSGCGVGGWFGGGSYLTKMDHGDLSVRYPTEPLVTVHWENTCCGEYIGKNIEYVISFIVLVPETLVRAGEALGEPMFDPNQTPLSSIKPPNGFQLSQAPAPTQPPTQPPTPSRGSNKFVLYNCTAERHTVYVWLSDQTASTGKQVGTLNPQYDASGSCPAGGSGPLEVPLTDGHVYQLVVVDTGLIGCGGNDPTNVSCRKLVSPIVAGDKNGSPLQFVVGP